MSKRHQGLLLTGVAVLVAMSIYGARALWGRVDDSNRVVSGGLPGSPVASAALQESLDAAGRVFSGVLDDFENGALGGEAHEPVLPTEDRSGCSWATGVPKGHASLVDEFLMGSVKAKNIMRHRALNFTDRPLCPEEESSLVDVLARFNRVVNPVLLAYQDVRRAELVELISAGRLAAWEGPPISDAALGRYARMLERDGKTADEVKTLVEGMKGRPSSPPAGVNYISHNGINYLIPDDDALPHSAAYFENVKFLVLEQSQVIIAWFVANGFSVDQGEIEHLLASIATCTGM